MYIHLTLVPYIGHAGELKTKPTQHSVNELRHIGIQPDMLICRSEGGAARWTSARRSRCSPRCRWRRSSRRATSTTSTRCRSGFHAEGVDDFVLDHFGIEAPAAGPRSWERLVAPATEAQSRPPVRIALVGKYVQLEDAYLSVVEALRHAGLRARLRRRDRLGGLRDAGRRARSARGSRRPTASSSRAASACAGSRARSRPPRSPATRGSRSSASASACRWRSPSSPATSSAWTARTRRSSTPRRRTRSSTCCPSRRRSPTWAARCGSARTRSSCTTARGRARSTARPVIYERHRHRYEVNNFLRRRLENAGLVVSGTSPDERLVEIIELRRPPVLRGLAVPPGVQVAPGAPGAAVPRVRRRRSSARRASAGRRSARAGDADPAPAGREDATPRAAAERAAASAAPR